MPICDQCRKFKTPQEFVSFVTKSGKVNIRNPCCACLEVRGGVKPKARRNIGRAASRKRDRRFVKLYRAGGKVGEIASKFGAFQQTVSMACKEARLEMDKHTGGLN